MTPGQAVTQAIQSLPSLVQLDACEADVIKAAKAMRHLSPPPGRIGTTEQMTSDDLFYMGWHLLLDALDRLAEVEA